MIIVATKKSCAPHETQVGRGKAQELGESATHPQMASNHSPVDLSVSVHSSPWRWSENCARFTSLPSPPCHSSGMPLDEYGSELQAKSSTRSAPLPQHDATAITPHDGHSNHSTRHHAAPRRPRLKADPTATTTPSFPQVPSLPRSVMGDSAMGRAAAPAIADIVKAHSDEMERCLAARAAQATRAPSQRQAAPGAASLPGGIELRRSGLSSLVGAMEVDSEPAGASSASLPSPPSSSPPLPRRASSLKRTCSHLSVDATPFYPRGEPAAARDASPPLSLTAEEQAL